MREQFAAAFGSDARNVLQRRSAPGFSAASAMAGDGETMRFVAHLLDEVQRRRVGRQRELMRGVVQIESLQARLAGDPWPRQAG